MIVPDDILPVATTSDGKTVFYKKDDRFDGLFILGDTRVPLTLADFFSKRTDITPIEDTDKTKMIWRRLRREMGVNELSTEYPDIKMARVDRFDPNAVDADADGRVQDGTPFERPAVERIAETGTRLLSRSGRRDRREASRLGITTDTSSTDFLSARQTAASRSQARAKGLSKAASKLFSGRQRSAQQRRKILDGTSFADMPGIRRLFKSRDDAYADLKESTIKTLADMQQKALSGTMVGKDNRQLDPAVIAYFQKTTPEKMWDDLEQTALRLHAAVDQMPIESRTQADVIPMILSMGMQGDPKNRMRRDDLRTPWVIGVLAAHGHKLTDEEITYLTRNGLQVGQGGRGDTYEALREVLEQAMGMNGYLDRKGRPIYGYYATPSPQTEAKPGMTELGARLADKSNGPNLPGYSKSSLVRLRPSVKDRAGYSYGDSLRNGILPRRIGKGDDKDTVLAVVHDRDFTDFKSPVGTEFRENQEEYLRNLIEWRLSGDISNLTRHDYIEAVVPFDVQPEEIEEIVLATDEIKVFADDLQNALVEIANFASSNGVSGNNYGDLLLFLQDQLKAWSATSASSGGLGDFPQLDATLKHVLQALKGRDIKVEGESKGIQMTVGPSRTSSPVNLEAALAALIQRFNP